MNFLTFNHSKLIRHSKLVILNFLLILLILSPSATWGISFNPEEVISDADFFRPSDMTRDEVQKFLEQKKSTLAAYTAFDSTGRKRSASDIIWSAATANGLNPKVVLVLLQKEQSLIENPNPSQYSYDWATGYARCDSCSPDSPTVAAYKGFALQVEKAAWRSNYYITNARDFTYRKGVESIVDGIRMIPRNDATAALYNYTPHFRGNFSFWKLWQRYFGKMYPDGMVLKEEGEHDIWLIQQGRKRKFASMGVFLSRYQEKDVVQVRPGDLATYGEGPPIRFPRYSLLQVPTGGVYLIVDDGKYAIPSKEIFKAIGFNPDEIMPAGADDVADLPTIGLLSSDTHSPIGELLQDKKTGGVFYVTLGNKHPILERVVLRTNFPYEKPRPVDSALLGQYALADPVLFADGTLVKTPLFPTVYIISNGQRRPIASQEAFETLGFQWSHIVESNGDTLSRHGEGEPITVGRVIDEEFPATLSSATLK
ncbi:hypothetical protein HY732_05050 [Candidatus Uhrbacteria bacterium]|nr:hypothetical protein [Candidatus Uhrbacteria bacterium]